MVKFKNESKSDAKKETQYIGKTVDFSHDFSMLFGNLSGGSIWFTNTYILDYASIKFGKHINVGPDTKLITSWHDEKNFNIVRAASIILEDNVWITMNSVVLPGVEIGENSIVGAGSIVTKSMPANSLIAGNPARVIRKIDRTFHWWDELREDVNLQRKDSEENNKNNLKFLRLYKSFYNNTMEKIRLLK